MVKYVELICYINLYCQSGAQGLSALVFTSLKTMTADFLRGKNNKYDSGAKRVNELVIEEQKGSTDH